MNWTNKTGDREMGPVAYAVTQMRCNSSLNLNLILNKALSTVPGILW
jgi:hypothetical protein